MGVWLHGRSRRHGDAPCRRWGSSVSGRHCIANPSVNASLDQLDRFLAAQSTYYATALEELRRGRKRSHWMWYILPRLRACVSAICAHTDTSAVDLLGDIDAQKLRSCLTLFAAAAKHDDVFDAALRQFFGGTPDPKTLELLASSRAEP